MRTVYATTLPGFYDTIAIAKGKWLQQLKNPSSTPAGLVAMPDNTIPQFNDTKLITLQKILMKTAGISGSAGSGPRAILDDNSQAILDDDGKAILE